jgi:DNA-directed RNA polymerase subunit RPC12/RpoP
MTGNLDAAKPKVEMSTTLEIQCPRCDRRVRLTAEIAPLGSEPGHRVYHCVDCGKMTIQDVARSVEPDTPG